MATKRQLWQRRKDYVRYIIRKQSAADAFSDLNAANIKAGGLLYGRLTEKMLRNDYDKRAEWMPVLLSMDNGSFLPELLAYAQEITQQGYAVYSIAMDPEKAAATKGKGLKPNLNTAIGALRTVFEGLGIQLRIAQGAGIAIPDLQSLQLTQNNLTVIDVTEEERKRIAAIARTALARNQAGSTA